MYRWATQGDEVAAKAIEYGIPIVRSDNNALVKRSSPLCRLIEACANWVTGGWKEANPPFRRLVADAVAIVLGPRSSEEEKLQIQAELIHFLRSTIESRMSANEWLSLFKREVLSAWRTRAYLNIEDWDVIDQMIERTDATRDNGNDLPLSHFGGRIEGSGRLNLSTLHSAKGREFDVVIMFAMNKDVIPNYYERKKESELREAQRQFYVGVTRARKRVYLVYQSGNNSPFVYEVYQRAKLFQDEDGQH